MIAAKAQARNRYYPTLVDNANWSGPSATTATHSVSIPETSVGDLIVVVFSLSQKVTTAEASSGWSNSDYAGVSGYIGSRIFWKLAEATDTLTVTTSGVVYSSAIILVFRGATEVDTVSGDPRAKIIVDSPALTPSNSDRQYTYITAVSAQSRRILTSAPAGFNSPSYVTGPVSLSPGTSVCIKPKSITDQSAGEATLSASVYFVPWTIAVYNP
jgi:hypothetical protein